MIKISVLMPVFNAERYIEEAIQSILNQTFKDFELLIINDGSTDNSASIIESFEDNRIRLIHNTTNLGLIKTLNKGIDLAKGKYIARMDADDIAHVERFSKQFQFSEKHPNYAIVGTQANFIFNDKLSTTLFKMEINSNLLPVLALFSCPFIHPSIMIKTSILKAFYYNEKFTAAEDYELWTRVLKKYTCINLSESLLSYRLHKKNLSKTKNKQQIDNIRQIYRSNLAFIKMPYCEQDLDNYLKLSPSYQQKISIYDLENMSEWLVKMQEHLLKKEVFREEAIRKVITIVWLQVCNKVKYNKLPVFVKYISQKEIKKAPIKDIIALFIKCLLSYPTFKDLEKTVLKLYR